jgi:predicted enzyme related to lactoylglutathione lyase
LPGEWISVFGGHPANRRIFWSDRAMPITVSLAAVAVTDLAPAKEFYSRLFGRPADLEPMPSLAQWDFPPSGGFQVVENAGTAGASMATLLVSDFDDFLARLHRSGLATGEVITGVLSRLTQIQDPAANVITIAEVPAR